MRHHSKRSFKGIEIKATNIDEMSPLCVVNNQLHKGHIQELELIEDQMEETKLFVHC